MKTYFQKLWTENPKVRKITGVVLVIVGLISIITPFTPLGFFLLLGLEVLGIRILVGKKLKSWFKK
ncbi:MAG: hypothetical protein Q7R89_03075 [bacterium]|nr:hypothetical protein [bacterium]